MTAILGAETPDEMIGIVVGEVSDLGQWQYRYSDLPRDWSGERAPADALQACPRRAIPLLCAAVGEANPAGAVDILECLVRVAFRDAYQGQLDVLQTQLVRAVVDAKPLWKLPSETIRWLAYAGLVSSRSSGPKARAELRGLL